MADKTLRELVREAENEKRKVIRKVKELRHAAGVGGKRSYADHQQEMARRSREASFAGRSIDPPPAVVNPDRRESCRMSLEKFCTTYNE